MPRVRLQAPESADDLRARIHALEQALVDARRAADVHQRAAEQARESTRHAFSLAAWGSSRRPE